MAAPDRSLPLPGHRFNGKGVSVALVPDLARLLWRRMDQLGLHVKALASMAGIGISAVSAALHPAYGHVLSPDQYGALGETLGLIDRAELVHRWTSASPEAALRELRDRARAAAQAMPSPAPAGDARLNARDLLGQERHATALAMRGFALEALADFERLAAVAESAGQRQAAWTNHLNAGQLLVELSRLEEAETAFANVRRAAVEDGHTPIASFAAVLEASTQFELGEYGTALWTLAQAEAGLEAALPYADLRSGGGRAGHRPVHMIHPHDRAVPPERLWWTARHLRTKVLAERSIAAGGTPRGLATARAAAQESRSLAQQLGLSTIGHDLCWSARLAALDGSESGLEDAKVQLAVAGPYLDRGVGPAYHRRAVGMRAAAAHHVDSETRAISALLDAADGFVAHNDTRGLGPTLSEVAIQFVVHARRAPTDAARRDAWTRAFRFAIAAAAFHPHGLVYHQVTEVLAACGDDGRTAPTRRADVEDLLAFRGEAFTGLRSLAAAVWPGQATAALRGRLGAFALVRPFLP